MKNIEQEVIDLCSKVFITRGLPHKGATSGHNKKTFLRRRT